MLRGSAGQQTKGGGRPRYMAKEKIRADKGTGRGKGEGGGAVGEERGTVHT